MTISIDKAKKNKNARRCRKKIKELYDSIDMDAAIIGRTLRLYNTTEIDGVDYSLNMDYYLMEADKLDEIDSARQDLYSDEFRREIAMSNGRLHD